MSPLPTTVLINKIQKHHNSNPKYLSSPNHMLNSDDQQSEIILILIISKLYIHVYKMLMSFDRCCQGNSRLPSPAEQAI